MFFIQYKYMTGPIEYDHIGPFTDQKEAEEHQKEYGPSPVTYVELDTLPYPLMDPIDHVEYLRRRF